VTTDARARVAGVLLALGCASVLGCANMNELRHGDSVDVSSYPPDIQRAYEVFALRCSRCHTLARPLNARIHDPQHWVRYVARMRRQPGSGIDHANADLILKFLLYYHRPPGATESGESEQPSALEDRAPSTEPQPERPAAPSAAPPAPVPQEAAPDAPNAPPPAALPPATDLDDTTVTPDGGPHGGDS
jgi:hypothetical protein